MSSVHRGLSCSVICCVAKMGNKELKLSWEKACVAKVRWSTTCVCVCVCLSVSQSMQECSAVQGPLFHLQHSYSNNSLTCSSECVLWDAESLDLFWQRSLPINDHKTTILHTTLTVHSTDSLAMWYPLSEVSEWTGREESALLPVKIYLEVMLREPKRIRQLNDMSDPTINYFIH